MATPRRRPRRRGGRLHDHRSAVASAAQTHPAALSRQHPARPRLHGSGVPVLGAPGSSGSRCAALSTASNRHAGRKAPLACLRTSVAPLPCGVAVSDCPGPSSTSNRGEAMAMLTADDVLNKKFQATKFREGYDQDEVDDFLDEVVNTLRVLTAESDDLKAKLAAAERRVAELSRAGESQPFVEHLAPAPAPDVVAEPEPEPEPELEPEPEPEPEPVARPVQAMSMAAPQRTSEPESATGMLQLAQKLHDDYVRAGQEEGDRIVNEAKVQAGRIVREAEETSSRTLAQLEHPGGGLRLAGALRRGHGHRLDRPSDRLGLGLRPGPAP